MLRLVCARLEKGEHGVLYRLIRCFACIDTKFRAGKVESGVFFKRRAETLVIQRLVGSLRTGKIAVFATKLLHVEHNDVGAVWIDRLGNVASYGQAK